MPQRDNRWVPPMLPNQKPCTTNIENETTCNSGTGDPMIFGSCVNSTGEMLVTKKRKKRTKLLSDENVNDVEVVSVTCSSTERADGRFPGMLPNLKLYTTNVGSVTNHGNGNPIIVGSDNVVNLIVKSEPNNNSSDARSKDNGGVYVNGGPTADFDSQVGPPTLPSFFLKCTCLFHTGFNYERFMYVLKRLISIEIGPCNRKRFKYSSHISAETKLLLTLIQLRHNYKFDRISQLFDIKPSICRKLFKNTVSCMKSNLIYPFWKTRRGRAQNIPKVSVEVLPKNYISVRKFYLENIKDPESEFVPAAIICTDPSGYIIFVSKILRGISDDDIFKESGLLEKLKKCPKVKPGDGILISNLIGIPEEILTLELETVICFPCVNIAVSRAFSQSEKAIKYLKEFDLLTKPIEGDLLNKVDSILLLCCFLTNMHLEEKDVDTTIDAVNTETF